ncbi:2Fe-2S iron-sulfur cluster-binding protein [Granulosicoccus sp.]|nr:Rieske 2Fe-2S domain-containing protein [Granulosicoccus sp.]MDB4223540.1 2Fe-2S iron-sulfur cluster-binding protein [Granulosicoccus sp.]
MSTNLQFAKKQWHPIAASTDLVLRHVYHAQLMGRELAVWRADDGHVNVWENRCLHRGVRLSIGINDGRELVCQYHGWRYANRTAGCTYIPAHPADAPARTICNNQYPVIEKDGLIWSSEADDKPEFLETDFRAGELLVLRAMPINATVAVVLNELIQQTKAERNSEGQVIEQGSFSLCVLLDKNDTQKQINYFIQPLDSNRSTVRAVLSGLPDGTSTNTSSKLQTLREHNDTLKRVQECAEKQMEALDTPPPWEPVIEPVSETLAYMPEISSKRHSLLRVKVNDMCDIATAIKSVELMSIEGQLPTFQPGAHIDVHLPNGMIRQYSLTNATGQTDRYIIGVKRETASSGGSSYIHDTLRIDDVVAVSAPRNNFPMRRDAVKTLLIAGGIGITPMLSMAQALHHSSMPFELHYFVQGEDHLAFKDILKIFSASLVVHSALDHSQTQLELNKILTSYQAAHHVYVCGPGPMLDLTRSIAENYSWPDDAVHFEYFKNTQAQNNSAPFEVSLSRSGLTLQVPSGKSLLEVLREHDIDLPSSCEQGACGTCKVTVTSGEPLHQDVYLSKSERQRGDCMMTCVSRAKSSSLTLDI